jgi:hypothetical protein
MHVLGTSLNAALESPEEAVWTDRLPEKYKANSVNNSSKSLSSASYGDVKVKPRSNHRGCSQTRMHKSWQARVCVGVSSTLMLRSNENKSCMRVDWILPRLYQSNEQNSCSTDSRARPNVLTFMLS